MNYQNLHQKVVLWADAMLLQVEKELLTNPSKRALLAAEINDSLRSAVDRQKRWPDADPMDIISYRSGDMWKYQFAAPLMITRLAARALFNNISARTKAYTLIVSFKNKQTLIIHGEHGMPTSQQRRQIVNILIKKEIANQLDLIRFPNTAYARELLIINIIVCMHASETAHLSTKDLPNADDLWSRYHSHADHDDIEPFIISRRWFQKRGGEDFHASIEKLDSIAARIKKDHSPSTFEEFWNLLVG